MSEIKNNNFAEEIRDDDLDAIVGGTTYPADWNQLSIEEKRARMVMSARLRQLGKPCEFDD